MVHAVTATQFEKRNDAMREEGISGFREYICLQVSSSKILNGSKVYRVNSTKRLQPIAAKQR